MKRKFMIAALAFAAAIPVFANTTKLPAPPPAEGQSQQVLRLMNDREFSAFLERLDASLLRSQMQLKKMDLQSLPMDAQERQELDRSYIQCLQSLDNTRDEIQKLSQKQTLKLDLYLLIDLNELARTLDSLDEMLVNPSSTSGANGARKSLGYAREILGIDGDLARQTSTFQQHFIAFTGVIDASLDQPEADASQPQK
jgi:hypothetical protein